MAYTPPGSQEFAIDSRGDLSLVVGADDVAVCYVVCSRTLARHSPVFSAMLYGGWAESKSTRATSTKPWVITLPEDKPGPFRRILDIAHANWTDIRTRLGEEQAFEILVLTNKYGMTKLLEPFMVDFCKVCEGRANPRKLFIVWEIGFVSKFELMVREIANNAYFAEDDDDHKDLMIDGEVLRDYEESPLADTLATIACARSEAAKRILEILRGQYTYLLRDFTCSTSNDYNRRGDKCKAVQIGVLVLALHRQNLSEVVAPSSTSTTWNRSVSELLNSASTLARERNTPENYCTCNAMVAFEATIKETQKSLSEPWALTDGERQRFRDRAEKSGLASS